MATKTLRVFAEYTSTGFVPMPTAGNIDYGYTLGSTFPATTPTSFQTDNPDLVVTVTAMTDFYVWIRVNGQAWNPSYTRNVRVYPDSPNINNVVMNMIIATGPAGVGAYTQLVQTSNRLYFNGATTDSIYNSKFAGKTYINELNFGTAPGLATVATSGAYADLTGKPTLATVATSGLFTDLSSKPSGTAPLSYNSGTNSFVITQANTSTNGYLSSTDWNTFNNKLATPAGTTLQYVDGTGALQTFPLLASADKLVITVRNSSGVSMPKGSVVYINGATGNKPTVALAQANSDASSAQTLGLLQATLANNAEGNVVIAGSVIDLNTSAFSEGQQLYLSPSVAGAYTATKQYAPNHLVYVGVVARSHVSLGVIEVKIQNGYEMDELHDVSAQNPSNNDGLFYNTTTGLWENKSIATVLGYTPYNGTDTSIKALFSATTPLSYLNGVYSISQATTSSNGYLSSTDWNTFNNKTLLNGTGFVKATGTTISYDNTSYLPLSGGLMTSSIQFSDTTNLKRGIYGSMGTDDNWFIGANASGVSQGYLEIATGDDGTEPIYATQYTGNAYTTGTVLRRVKILDESGNSIFPNSLTANSLIMLGGTSSQFLKANGTVDNNVYLTTSSASSTYLTIATAANTYQTIITNNITGTGTINELAYFNTASTIASLGVATYPSLTELSYVKGVTSAIQTQINTKQATISLTTTGTSGAATFSSNTLNIPNYGSALSGYLPLTGGTLTGALGGTSASFSSSVFINGDFGVGNTSTFGWKAFITSSSNANLALGSSVAGVNIGFFDLNTTVAPRLGGVTNDLVFTTFTIERMRINVDGNVGIGTTTPRSQLHIANNTTGSVVDSSLQLGYSLSDYYGFKFINSSNPSATNAGILKLQRGTGSYWADTLTINDTGNISIGTTSGTSRLQVRGVGTYNNNFSATNSTVQIISDEMGVNQWYPTFNIAMVRQSLSVGQNSFGGIGFTTIDDSNNSGQYDAARIAIINNNGADLLTGTSMAFYTQVGGVLNTNPATEQMRIRSNGNVLIGTTTDGGFKLDVNGTARVSGAATFSSSITATNGTFYLGDGVIGTYFLGGSGNVARQLKFSTSTTTNAGDTHTIDAQSITGQIIFNTASTPRLTIASTGAATFTSSVTATAFIPSGATIPTNGMYLAAANTLNFATASTERMRITATGNVGIGVVPSTWGSIFRAIQVGVSGSIVSATSATETDIALYSNTYYDGTNYKILNSTTQVPSYFQLGDGTLQLATGNIGAIGSNVTGLTTRFTVSKVGVVTMGQQLTISNTTNSYATMNFGAGASYGWQIGKADNSGDIAPSNGFYIYSIANPANRFSITGGGNVLIGTIADNGYKLYVSGTIYATGNITANSDLTLKKNLKLIDNPIDKLMSLNGYAYQWKSDDSHQYGVIAQEVEKILPYAVSTGNDGIKGVSYNQLTPLLIEGFKSHESEITQLKKRVKTQQAEINTLKSKLA